MRNQTAIASLLLVASAASAGCKPPQATGAGGAATVDGSPVKVATFVAAAEKVPRLVPLTGTLKANAESAVAANAAGRIVRTLVERGTAVAKDAPLVLLDRRASALAAQVARANVASARTQKDQADAECQRQQRLYDKRIITQQEYEKTSSSCSVETQSLAVAETRLNQATLTVNDATVRAPFAGVITERYVNVGEYVREGTQVARVVQSDPLRLELVAGEQDVGAVQVGLTVTFQVKGVPARVFAGTVKYVAPTLRAATRDLVFEAVVPNADGVLKAGMFATASLESGTEERVVVPKTALRQQGDTLRAFVVKQGRLEERVVQKLRDQGDRVILGRGLEPGERVVAECGDGLKDGARVVE